MDGNMPFSVMRHQQGKHVYKICRVLWNYLCELLSLVVSRIMKTLCAIDISLTCLISVWLYHIRLPYISFYRPEACASFLGDVKCGFWISWIWIAQSHEDGPWKWDASVVAVVNGLFHFNHKCRQWQTSEIIPNDPTCWDSHPMQTPSVVWGWF